MKPERRLVSRETARLLPIVVPVALSGFAVLAFAIGEFVASNPEPEVLAGVFALLLAATFVEAHPVPIEGIYSEGISLEAVFIVGNAVIYGWAPAVVEIVNSGRSCSRETARPRGADPVSSRREARSVVNSPSRRNAITSSPVSNDASGQGSIRRSPR